jgi:hypothetical protein
MLLNDIDFVVGDQTAAKPVAAAKPAPAAEKETTPPPAKTEAAKPAQQPAQPQQQQEAQPSGGRVNASPLARRIANERGVPLSQVSGTGPGRRIVKDDILEYKPSAAAASATHAAPAGAAGEYQDIPHTNIRKVLLFSAYQLLLESRRSMCAVMNGWLLLGYCSTLNTIKAKCTTLLFISRHQHGQSTQVCWMVIRPRCFAHDCLDELVCLGCALN